MELQDIKKLADLARIEMTEEEMRELAHDFEPILAYVGQIKEAVNLAKDDNDYSLINVARHDEVTNTPGFYTEKIINEMPDKQNGYLKVKQIL